VRCVYLRISYARLALYERTVIEFSEAGATHCTVFSLLQTSGQMPRRIEAACNGKSVLKCLALPSRTSIVSEPINCTVFVTEGLYPRGLARQYFFEQPRCTVCESIDERDNIGVRAGWCR
jgi:hypothetical protein